MPKVRRVSVSSVGHYRASPYPSNPSNGEQHRHMNSLGSVDDVKEWDEVRCPICMEHPHNAVLLKCSSHDMGCRPYMCNSSYRHSNCLDQFCKSYAPHLSTAILQEIPLTGTASRRGSEGHSQLEYNTECGGQLQPSLVCPLCRGEIYGYMVVEAARKYMNSKPRSCSSETCNFSGTYQELRLHARSEHPSVRPAAVDPTRQQDWQQLERERDMEDILSSIQLSSGEGYSRDIITSGGLNGLMSLFLLEILSSIGEAVQMTRQWAASRDRVPLHNRRSARISYDANTPGWRSHGSSNHYRARWRFISGHDSYANAWSSSSSYYRRPRNQRLRWRDQRWQTYDNRP